MKTSSRRQTQTHTLKEQLSPQALELLRIIRFLTKEHRGGVSTSILTRLRGTRTGPTNRMLQRLQRKGYVRMVEDPAEDKAERLWNLT